MKFMKGLWVIQAKMRFMSDLSDDDLPNLSDLWRMWLICEVLVSMSEQIAMIKECMCDYEWLWGYVFVSDWEGEWTTVSAKQETMNIKKGLWPWVFVFASWTWLFLFSN
jgi:hypothetical protein